MKRGDAFARPDAISGVIPGAVDVADYMSPKGIYISQFHAQNVQSPFLPVRSGNP